jgi:Anti-sigma factor NepR
MPINNKAGLILMLRRLEPTESGEVLLLQEEIFSREACVRTPKKSIPAEDTLLNGVALDPKVLDVIGGALKAHYDDLVHTPLPQKILDLLAQLEKGEQKE